MEKDYIIITDTMLQCIIGAYKHDNNKEFRKSLRWFYDALLRCGVIIDRDIDDRSYTQKLDGFITNPIIEKRYGGVYSVKYRVRNKSIIVNRIIMGFGDLTNFAQNLKYKDRSKFQNILFAFTKMNGIIRINGEYYV